MHNCKVIILLGRKDPRNVSFIPKSLFRSCSLVRWCTKLGISTSPDEWSPECTHYYIFWLSFLFLNKAGQLNIFFTSELQESLILMEKLVISNSRLKFWSMCDLVLILSFYLFSPETICNKYGRCSTNLKEL